MPENITSFVVLEAYSLLIDGLRSLNMCEVKGLRANGRIVHIDLDCREPFSSIPGVHTSKLG